MFELFGCFLVVLKASAFATENRAFCDNQGGALNIAENLGVAGEL